MDALLYALYPGDRIMKKLQYVEVEDGQWITPADPRKWRVACCDCGAIHVYRFELDKRYLRHGELNIRIVKDYRATGQRRRALKRRREGLWKGDE